MSLMPSYRDWYKATDQTPHYAFLKHTMAALQWFRDGRWLLKCQQHLEQLQPVLNVFPDSTFIFTHRDPVAVVASAVTMLAYRARLFNRKVDPVKIGAYWVDRIESLLRGVVRDHALAPPARSLHGGRCGHGEAHLRVRESTIHRAGAERDARLHEDPSTRAIRPDCL
jgi:hypothetical protein